MPVREVLELYSKEQIKKASRIKAIFFDVDGVLTNGGIAYDDTGKEFKQFNVKDGYIISHLKKAGIIVGIISGRESATVTKRAAELKLDFCHQGIIDKKATFRKLVDFHKIKTKNVAYIGDDINDLGVFMECGLSACPADAIHYVRSRVEIVTRAKGGEGALRELADLVLASTDVLDKIIKENS